MLNSSSYLFTLVIASILILMLAYGEDQRRDECDKCDDRMFDVIMETKKWVEQEQCKHLEDFKSSNKRRSPLSMLSQFGVGSDKSRKMSTFAYIYENVTSQYRKRFEDGDSIAALVRLCELSQSTPSCFPQSMFPSNDGTCNNPIHPKWGRSFTPMIRYLTPDYADGLSEPRLSANGQKLPSARKVSITVISHKDVPEPGYTALNSHFGQFLDHDIGHTPTERGLCGCKESSVCMPIEIPESDEFFSVPCFPFLRSLPSLDENCKGPRQQLNQITSFIDGSVIYGSSDDVVDSLRNKEDGLGLLVTEANPTGVFSLPHLPKDIQESDCASIRHGHHCGRSGDVRTSEQTGLTILHTLFHRNHNLIALQLFQMNPFWDDSRLFQETRRINTAIFQHITYNEYLPLVIGPRMMGAFEIKSNPAGYFFGYNYSVNPGISNVVSTSAFRFGHSQVSFQMTRVNPQFEEVFNPLLLAEAFFNGSIMFDGSNGGIDSIALGMVTQQLQKVDLNIDIILTRHLFNFPPFSPALDLVAFNIQRGRDHGIPSYVKWRKFCGLPDVSSIDDLRNEMREEIISRLKKVYSDVRDIDLFIGSIAETPLADALVGPTNACILGRQFHDLKAGDRFWYETGNQKTSFTKDQLAMIRTMTMSRLMCDNLERIESIQPFAFRSADEGVSPGDETSFYRYNQINDFPDLNRDMPGFSNVRVSCRDFTTIPPLDLCPWSEQGSPFCSK